MPKHKHGVDRVQYVVKRGQIKHSNASLDVVCVTHPRQRLKSQVMTLDRFDSMCPGEPSVSIHHKSNMLWNWPLLERSNQQLPESGQSELDWRGCKDPFPKTGQVH